ncbi:MAG: hypothetical protein A2275_05015 [Bacteroidetes bacterium RIFOXYA12_FULL_35_11]|nr:MAG: hypothetical protein A2X01_07450 [Bacteroidetes bacterium GWF2_35_48]OFY78133.1 MAG: hypothetical protein A2275_05015 [Bacteroidetes bacterium RIFOXYA12_FULL_35_11]OFY92588.1 MAG: hypothetical protein A2491_08570 [Bacteroidetes bacterium RIFOXYC12_FULL_35_7]OFY94692.1 MAG: hypothetical protein A2309_07510 [Bacteroidetes bacterium RIFOXYB2_FULL_35_7]HBX52889.1 hypothetical protein [Bacteroidales bacterium]
MSILMNFAMFPTDKGPSVSEHVSKVIEMISKSGVSYKLTPMSTIIETETLDEALEIVKKAYSILEPVSDRIYSSMNFDIRKNKSGRMKQKIESIESKIGKVST